MLKVKLPDERKFRVLFNFNRIKEKMENAINFIISWSKKKYIFQNISENFSKFPTLQTLV